MEDDKAVSPSRVLIIDHSPAAEVLRSGLEACGLEVAIEKTYDAGFERAVQTRPELVVIEWDWSERSGLDLISDLRAAHEATTIIVVTTFASIPAAARAIRAGAADYLIKPVAAAELLAILDESHAACPVMSLQDARREYIREVLIRCKGSIAEASRVLRVERTSLRRMMARLGIRPVACSENEPPR